MPKTSHMFIAVTALFLTSFLSLPATAEPEAPSVNQVVLDTIQKAQDLVKHYRVNFTPPEDPTQANEMALSNLAQEHDLILRRMEEELEIHLLKAERDYAWKAAREDDSGKIKELQEQLRHQIQEDYVQFRTGLLAEIYRYLQQRDALKS